MTEPTGHDLSFGTHRERNLALQSLSIGPLALPLNLLALLLAAGAALIAGRLAVAKPEKGIGDVLTEMFLAGVLVARAAFVGAWFDVYRHAPLTALDIRDGGFMPWAGVAAAVLVAVLRGWRRPGLRRGLAAGLLAGGVVYAAMAGTLSLLQRPAMPEVPLQTLAGEAAQPLALAGGKPMVVNLWATWCPPCRREMPMLVAAQRRETDVAFIFIDQGEDAATVRRFLAAGHLAVENVLLDPGGRFGHEVGSMALPTTLFYDGSGRLVDSRVGALAEASLASRLARLRERTRKVSSGVNGS